MLKTVPYFLKTYNSGLSDEKRSVMDFIECEPREMVSSFRNELYAVSQGSQPDEVLDKVIGAARKMKHGSYAEWAKLLLQWMAGKLG